MFLIDEEVLFEAEEPKEQEKPQKLTKQGHFDHVEDLLFRGGEKGYKDALKVLDKTYGLVKGRSKGINVSTKFDGSPGILWGHANGKFFVSTKSFFNQSPKLNHTTNDIQSNHGKSKGLATRLQQALKYLPEVTPKKGIFRGDLMFTKDDIEHANGNIKFTPNTLSYNVPDASEEGQKILKAKIGVVPHMEYEEQPNGSLKARFDLSPSRFKKSDNVHMIDPQVKGPHEMHPEREKDYIDNISQAQKLKSELDSNHSFMAIEGHQDLLLGYINNCVKEGKPKSVGGYISFLTKKAGEHIGSLKQDKTKSKVQKELDDEIFKINQNKKGLDTLFKVHGHLAKAKKALTDTLGKNSPYKETVLDKPAKPEGFVASVDGQPVKLVDRSKFSAQNFEWNNKVNPEDNPLVLTFGRMNPATKGHGKLLDKADDVARRIGAKAKTVLTNTQDKKNNPLTPAEKLKWAKTLFPGKDIALASPDKGTIIAQLQHAHHSGVQDMTIVTGSDKAKMYQDIINKHNGPTKNHLFNFKRARIVVANRNKGGKPGSEDPEDASATRARDAAMKDDFGEFKKVMPKGVSDDATKEVYHTVRANAGVVKIDDKTDAHALVILSKRHDDIGKQAKKEVERRKNDGVWTGHVHENFVPEREKTLDIVRNVLKKRVVS